MTTINFTNRKISTGEWSQDSNQTVQVSNNWQAIWQSYCAYIASSVMSFTQSTTHREIIVEVISLCKNQITDKATWQSLAARARLAASETSELNMDEECRAAVLTVLAIAQLAISFDKKWLERASSMSIRAISEGWSAYAFGCSKSMVAKFASETAITDLAAKATELALLATAVQPAMVA